MPSDGDPLRKPEDSLSRSRCSAALLVGDGFDFELSDENKPVRICELEAPNNRLGMTSTHRYEKKKPGPDWLETENPNPKPDPKHIPIIRTPVQT